MDAPEQCVKIKWEGDHSGFRRLVPNVMAKEFVAMHVKTPTSKALIKEMAVVHSLAEAAVQTPGSLEHRSAVSGTEGATAAIGVAFTPAAAALPASNNDRPVMSEINMVMALPEAERGAMVLSYLHMKQREREHDEKRRRIEVVHMASRLLSDFNAMDKASAEWLQREAKNAAMLVVGCSATPKALTMSSTAEATPDNPLWWTVVSRAAHLNPAFKCKTPVEESKLGRKVSDAFKERYGGRPAEVNAGKLPQGDKTGVARATNVLTEAQCREVADDAIRVWFAA